MALLPIVEVPDPRLRQISTPLESVDDEVRSLVADMFETMYAAPGIGLAATQIGVPLRVFVVDLSVGRNTGELIVMVNPEWIEREGTQIEEEGCLSAPGFNATVVRPKRAVLKGLTPDGGEQTIEGTDLLARAFQHEMDHLDGTVFIDRLRGIKRDLIVRKIQKLKKSGKW
jgi:peptide deformylase